MRSETPARPTALVLRALGLGDLLAGVPALRALRRALPGHEIVLAAPPALEPLARLTGAVDRLLPQQELEPITWPEPPPDVAVDLHGNGPASHTILEELRPRRMVAFDRPGTGSDRPVWDDEEHERHRWCRLVGAAFDVVADPDDLLLPHPDAPASDPAVVIHPGAGYPARRWPTERFAAVARHLAAQGHRVVVTGGPAEQELANAVAADAGLPDDAVLAGRTDLPGLAAVVAAALLVVCGDTGVAHLASAYRRPSVVLFGPTPPARWGPPADGPHAVLWEGAGVGDPWSDEPDEALLAITVDEVLAATRVVSPGNRSALALASLGTPDTTIASKRDTVVKETLLPREMGRPDAALAGFEHGPVLTLVAEGPELTISAINAVDRALAGRDVLGLPLRETLGDLLGPHMADRVQQVYDTGEPYVGREWRVRMQDGEDSSEHYLDFFLSPWRNSDGSIRGVVAQGIDLTERVTARRAVEERMDAVTEDYQRVSEVVTAMQDALLPTDLPVLPGVEVAARYLLQEDLTLAGGDWFDAIPLVDGRLTLVVGDVVGSGVLASGIMGQLRAVLHERLASGATGPEALVALDRFARGLPEAHAATVCLAHLDAESGELVYCTAGHPPPLVLDRDGHTHYVAGTGGRPLGVSHRAADVDDFPVLRERLDTDAMVLLYSDGAVERPGRSSAENTVELARVVSTIRETSLDPGAVGQLEVDRVCERTLDVLAWLSGYDDDITILAAQRVPRVTPLDLRVPAAPASADRLRTDLGRWLDSLALSDLDRTVLVHAANELASNAIDHAYPRGDDGAPSDGVVEMRAELLTTGVVEVTVCDRGRWRDPDLREQYRGRGLALTSGLVDELEVSHGEPVQGPGTVAKIRHRVRRAASLLSPMTGRTAYAQSRDVPFSLSTHEREHRLDVAGAVDEASSDRLLAVLRTMSRGGAVTVTADLSAVTQLPSVAVRALYESHSQMQGGAELRLIAEMGSPAQHVLDVVGLPYTS
jgi:ADP-heptose:LPS heptosyltransferase/serine phosphatase RsbU (regulator of sigma subunit)/anti-sigma regulatory factor (Ser/Thr protein kinase)